MMKKTKNIKNLKKWSRRRSRAPGTGSPVGVAGVIVSIKFNENHWKSMKMSSCCWGSEGVWGGYPPPAIAGRTCCWGSGGGTPPDQLLADAAVGVRGGVERTVDITSCGRWRRTEKSKWINIQKANQTAERFRGTMKPLRRKQCCAWAASLASKAGSVASKKEQQEEDEKIRQTLKMF